MGFNALSLIFLGRTHLSDAELVQAFIMSQDCNLIGHRGADTGPIINLWRDGCNQVSSRRGFERLGENSLGGQVPAHLKGILSLKRQKKQNKEPTHPPSQRRRGGTP